MHKNTQPHVRRCARLLPENNKVRGGEGGGSTSEGLTRELIEASHLQLLHLAGPAAAFLTVDAADGQSQDLLL